MAKTIHTIKLAGGSVDTRESASRRYTHAITVLFTPEYDAHQRTMMAGKVRDAKAEVARLEALRNDADKAEYAAAKAMDAYLEEKVTVTKNGQTYQTSRWLTDEYDGVEGRSAFDSKGYRDRKETTRRVYATIESKYEAATQTLARLEKTQAEYCDRAGTEVCLGWSSSPKSAHSRAASETQHYIGAKVCVRTDFETRERAVRAKKVA